MRQDGETSQYAVLLLLPVEINYMGQLHTIGNAFLRKKLSFRRTANVAQPVPGATIQVVSMLSTVVNVSIRIRLRVVLALSSSNAING